MVVEEYDKIKTSLDVKDIAFLNKYHSKHISVNYLSETEITLKANSYVGKIVLPSKKKIQIKPKIKINNLLYIISFTYDIVDFKYTERRSINENTGLGEIYITVFLNWVDSLLKKGLYKDYQHFEEDIAGIKGKIIIGKSLINRATLHCEYYDISFANKENSIIKATLLLIINQKTIDKTLIKRSLQFYRLFNNINSIKLTKTTFKNIHINRFNNHYRPILEICELIFNNLKLKDEDDNYIFSGFMVNMNNIFEKFLLKALQNKMKSENIGKSSKREWAKGNQDYLPQIEPDIYVKRKAIIDAKYYKTPFTSNDKFISGHIYQIITYLKAYNLKQGFLVYPEPENSRHIDCKFKMDDMEFNIMTIPLNKEIRDIELSINKIVEQIETINVTN